MAARVSAAGASSALLGWSTRAGLTASDVIAIAMPAILVGGALSFALTCVVAPSWRVVPLTLVLTAAALVYGPRFPQRTEAPASPVRVASVNLKASNGALAGVVATIVGLEADVVVVSELTVEGDELLAPSFDHEVLLDVAGVGSGIGVYSRYRLTDLGYNGFAGSLIRVNVGSDEPFVLYATHLPRPGFAEVVGPSRRTTFRNHRAFVEQLDGLARAEMGGPVVIAGDLNLSDRTGGYRQLVDGRRDVARAGWAGSTYEGFGPRQLAWRLLLLRIDYVMVPRSWCVAGPYEFAIPGSDHRGVVADVGPCRARGTAMADEARGVGRSVDVIEAS